MVLREFDDDKLKEYELNLDRKKINDSYVPKILCETYENECSNLFYDIATRDFDFVTKILSQKPGMIDSFKHDKVFIPCDANDLGTKKEEEQLDILRSYSNGNCYAIGPKIIYYDGDYGKFYLRTVIVPSISYTYDEKNKLYLVKNVIDLPGNLFKIHAYANGDINFISDNDIFLDKDQTDFFNLKLTKSDSQKFTDENQKKKEEEYTEKSAKILRRI